MTLARDGWRALAHHREGLRLFTLVFLTLVMELSLIRFASAEVLYLGYFANYILISAFLGIGLGFLAVRREIDLFGFVPQGLLFFVSFVLLSHIDLTFVRSKIGQLYFGADRLQTKIPLYVALPLFFVLTVFLFAAVAQETGRAFRSYKAIVAYTIDIAGSLAGIVFFTVLSYLGAPPTVWFGVIFALLAILSRGKPARVAAIAMGAGVILLLVAARPSHYLRWSPYQKIEVTPKEDGYFLRANGIGHQTMGAVSHAEPLYQFPYWVAARVRDNKPYRRVLIIGAGSGTDVAYGLQAGVEHIDAVEIDPQIQKAGRIFHPNHPYDSDKVTRIVDDGRAFMGRTHERYDLVIFALPDSLALVSSFSSVRLESYLFTLESFDQAKRLLTDDGVLVLYNYYRQPWLLSKIKAMLETTFGHPPFVVVYSEPGDIGLLAGVAIGPTVGADKVETGLPPPTPSTDDWPFLYMDEPGIAPMYLAIMAMFIVGAAIGIRIALPPPWAPGRAHLSLFFMGAAFFLLETKSVIQFSLLFGATWLVNALVFAAILLSVLAANLLVMRLNLQRVMPMFAAVFLSLLVGYLLPMSQLLRIESLAVRYVVASVILFSPVFFANLAFGILFRDDEDATSALGANLMGAMVGGTLEYTSLLLGYRNLAIVVGLLYLAASGLALSGKRGSVAAAPAGQT